VKRVFNPTWGKRFYYFTYIFYLLLTQIWWWHFFQTFPFLYLSYPFLCATIWTIRLWNQPTSWTW